MRFLAHYLPAMKAEIVGKLNSYEERMAVQFGEMKKQIENNKVRNFKRECAINQ